MRKEKDKMPPPDDYIAQLTTEVATCGLPLELICLEIENPAPRTDSLMLIIFHKGLGGVLAVKHGDYWKPCLYITNPRRGTVSLYSRGLRWRSKDWRKAVITTLQPDPTLKAEKRFHLFVESAAIRHPMRAMAVITMLEEDIQRRPYKERTNIEDHYWGEQALKALKEGLLTKKETAKWLEGKMSAKATDK